MTIKAIIFDYIGTLVEPKKYALHESKLKLHKALCQAGLTTNLEEFMDAYTNAHEKYRIIRYEQLKEITNAIWVSEALNNIQCPATVEDARLKEGLNVFFQDFIDSLKLRPHAKQLINKASEHSKIGLVSNFTYAPAIHASLRKLHIDKFFNAIVISEAIGWRKPNNIIFNEVLRALQVKPEEAVFIGDSPIEDINGAKAVGMRTIFVSSCFNSLGDVEKNCGKPDLIFEDLEQIYLKLPEIIDKF